MILTDKFVYIHQPKTGGTFVTHVLSLLFKKKNNILNRFSNKFSRISPKYIDTNKHGTCCEIPESHLGKPIVASIRSPYDRYVSQYEFGWWKKYPPSYCNVNEIYKSYPHFPDISFSEFIHLTNSLFLKLENSNFSREESLGRHTEQFVRYFFKKPNKIFQSIDADYLSYGNYRKDMFNVNFIQVDRLNAELYEFLLKLGYSKRKLKFILELNKIFPHEGGRNKGQKWQKYFSPELKTIVRKKERLIFKIFPEYDI